MRAPQWYRDLDLWLSRFISPMVRRLLYINVAVWLVGTLVFGLFLTQWHGPFIYLFACTPLAVLGGRVWQFVTYMFLHVEAGHLFWNMLMLWFFGSVMEQHFGRRRFLWFYLICGAGAAVVYEAVTIALVYSGKAPAMGLAPMLGASGALYGILFAFGYLYPDQPVLLGFLIPIPARVLVAVLVVLSFVGSINPGRDNTAHLCHLAGMGVSYLLLKCPRLMGGRRGPVRVDRYDF